MTKEILSLILTGHITINSKMIFPIFLLFLRYSMKFYLKKITILVTLKNQILVLITKILIPNTKIDKLIIIKTINSKSTVLAIILNTLNIQVNSPYIINLKILIKDNKEWFSLKCTLKTLTIIHIMPCTIEIIYLMLIMPTISIIEISKQLEIPKCNIIIHNKYTIPTIVHIHPKWSQTLPQRTRRCVQIQD